MGVDTAIFRMPIQKYDELKRRLNKTFPNQLAVEIEAFVQIKTQEKFDPLINRIVERFNSLEALYDLMDQENTTEEKKELLKRYFELINPAWIANDLKYGLSFNEIRNDYENFIEEMAKGQFGELFLRYKFGEEVFDFLNSGLLEEVDTVTGKLRAFSEKVTAHFLLLRDIKEGEKAKAYLKMAATGAGLAVGVPFMGMAAGAVLNGNSEAKVSRSLNEVDDFLAVYRNSLNEFLMELENRYKYILMSIYGGTFLQMRKQFAMLDVELADINLGIYTFELKLVNEEQNQVRKWAEEGFATIKDCLDANNIKEAAIVANRLFHTVNQNPLLKNVLISKGKSLIYMANMYKFSVLSCRAMEIRKGSKKHFLRFTAELFKQLPYVVNHEDMNHLKTTNSFDLVAQFISTSLTVKMDLQEKKTLWIDVLDHYSVIIARSKGKASVFYEGELSRQDESMDPLYLNLINFFSFYIDNKYKCENDLSTDFGLPPYSVAKKMARTYKQAVGKDKFFSYMIVIRSLTIGVRSLQWTVRLIGRVIRVIATPKRAIFSGISLLAIIACFYFISADGQETLDGWKNKASGLFDTTRISNKRSVSQPLIMTVAVDMANIRNAPRLDSKVVDTAYDAEHYYILGEEQDNEGRIWYNICSEAAWDGTFCTVADSWISAKVLK